MVSVYVESSRQSGMRSSYVRAPRRESCPAAQGASKLNMDPPKPAPSPGLPRQVVYVPSCVTRMMGPSRSDSETASVHEKLLSLFAKAGYEVIYPEVRVPRAFCPP